MYALIGMTLLILGFPVLAFLLGYALGFTAGHAEREGEIKRQTYLGPAVRDFLEKL